MVSIRRLSNRSLLAILIVGVGAPLARVEADGLPLGQNGTIQIPGLPFEVPVAPHAPRAGDALGPDGVLSGKGGPTVPTDQDLAPDKDLGRLDNDLSRRMPPAQGHDFGSTIIGPGGMIQPRHADVPKKVPTPEERAADIRKALMPKPPLALARRHTLDTLYGKLATADDEDEAKGLATLIANIWMRSGSDTAALLMQRATQALAAKDYPVALSVLDKIVELQPGWAEAWNKRASVRFVAGDLDGSMADVEHVLKLEPKHFGALQGMAMILQRTGFDKQALEVYRREMAIYPHQPDVQGIVDKLVLQVEGQGI